MAEAHKNAGEAQCALRVSAKLVSLNGGVVLSVCILLSAVTFASVQTGRFVLSQSLLFLFLSLASWIYLLDSVSETMCLEGDVIKRTSLLGRSLDIRIADLKSLLLKHEGLNASMGIESITVVYRDGREDRLPLGPCWRRRDLEAFLESAEQIMGYKDLLAQDM